MSLLLGRSQRLVVILFICEGLLPVRLPVRVYFLHQLLGIMLEDCRDLRLDLFLRIGIGFDAGPVNEDGLRQHLAAVVGVAAALAIVHFGLLSGHEKTASRSGRSIRLIFAL